MLEFLERLWSVLEWVMDRIEGTMMIALGAVVLILVGLGLVDFWGIPAGLLAIGLGVYLWL